MTFQEKYLDKLKKNPRAYSPTQALVQEIYTGKDRKMYGMLGGMIKRKGLQFSRETWQEVSKSDAKDKIKLFMWKLGKMKVELR